MRTSKSKQKRFYDKRFLSVERASHKFQSQSIIFFDRRLLEIVLRAFDVAPVDTVLEVGCGQASDAMLISERASHVVALDLSRIALRTAKNMLRMNKARQRNISFVSADAEYSPFREDVFDLVYCKDLLHHVSNPKFAISEMKRAVKKGGKVAAIEANAYSPQMVLIALIYFEVDKGIFSNTRSRLISLFLESGLYDVKAAPTEFLPRHLLFEYRSPFNRFVACCSSALFDVLRRMEEFLQKKTFLEPFSNYLVIVGEKRKGREGCKA